MPNSIKKLEEAFKEGKYDQLLKDIYVDEAAVSYTHLTLPTILRV